MLPLHNARFGMTKLIDGSAHLPFVTRALVPTLLGLVPPSLQMTALIGIVYISILATLYILQQLTPNFNPWLASFWLLPLMAHYNQLYDMVTLALSAALLFAMLRGRDRLYIVLFALMCLNKETSILFALPSLVMVFISPGRTQSVLFLAQVIIYGAIRGLLMFRFAANPGEPLEWHLLNNLIDHVNQHELTIFTLCTVALIVWRIAERWQFAPHGARLTLITIAPVLVVLYLVGGVTFEYRVFYEIWPVTWLLATTNQYVSEMSTNYKTPY